jgi:hypothetical protein
MPTVIPYDVLKLTDKDGRPIEKVEFVDPENPLLLIDPEIGKVYESTVFLKNDSEHKILNIRFQHDYSDIRILPEYIHCLKKGQKMLLTIVWKPFSEIGISEKIKDNKVSVSFQTSCTVEVVTEIKEEV